MYDLASLVDDVRVRVPFSNKKENISILLKKIVPLKKQINLLKK